MRAPSCGMGADVIELVFVERPGLAEHGVGHGELADVVQRGADAQDVDLLVVPAEPRGDDLCDRGHARRMARRVRVTSLDCAREVHERHRP